MANRIEEIEVRLSAIATEIEAEGADVKALANETDALMEESPFSVRVTVA